MDKTLERIMELMRDNKIQDQEMIEYLGLTRGTFGNWKRDKGRSYYAYIDKIADRLCVPIDYLIRGKQKKARDLRTKRLVWWNHTDDYQKRSRILSKEMCSCC